MIHTNHTPKLLQTMFFGITTINLQSSKTSTSWKRTSQSLCTIFTLGKLFLHCKYKRPLALIRLDLFSGKVHKKKSCFFQFHLFHLFICNFPRIYQVKYGTVFSNSNVWRKKTTWRIYQLIIQTISCHRILSESAPKSYWPVSCSRPLHQPAPGSCHETFGSDGPSFGRRVFGNCTDDRALFRRNV